MGEVGVFDAEEVDVSPSGKAIAWRPHPGPQELLVRCPVKDVFYGGARGGGKSAGGLMAFAAHAKAYGERAKGIAFRRSYPEFEELVRDSTRFFRRLQWHWSKADRTWESPEGATLILRYLDTDSDAELYQGHSYTFQLFEEAGNWPDPAPIDLLAATLRSPDGVPCVRRLNGNPGGIGHGWIQRRYIDPAAPGVPFISETGMQAVFIPAKIEDNPTLWGTDYEQNIRAATFGNEELWKAWRHGDWSAIVGVAFPEWNPLIHVVQNRDIFPQSWKFYGGLDWGYAKGAAVLNVGNSERMEVVDATELVRMTAKDAGGFLATRWAAWRDQIDWLAYSPDMDTDTGLGKTLTRDFREGWKAIAGKDIPMLPGIQKPGSREAKFALMHQALAWTNERDETGKLRPWCEPFLVVQERAKYFRESIPILPLDKKNPNDIDTEANDHGYDAEGFIVGLRNPPIKKSKAAAYSQDKSMIDRTTGRQRDEDEHRPQTPRIPWKPPRRTKESWTDGL